MAAGRSVVGISQGLLIASSRRSRIGCAVLVPAAIMAGMAGKIGGGPPSYVRLVVSATMVACFAVGPLGTLAINILEISLAVAAMGALAMPMMRTTANDNVRCEG